jgi:hypothetical protein
MEQGGKEKWFPGKYMIQAVKGRRADNAAGDSGSTRPTEIVPESSAAGSNLKGDRSGAGEHSTSRAGLKEWAVTPAGAVVVGQLRLRILAVKYLRISNPKLSLQLDGTFLQRGLEPSFHAFEKTFDVLDIASDLSISVTGRAETGKASVCGVIMISLPNLLAFSGAPKAAKEQWMMLLPVPAGRWAESSHASPTQHKPFKFASGYADLPGYALTRSKVPLGFLRVKVELTLSQHALKVYTLRSLRAGAPAWRSAQAAVAQVCVQTLHFLAYTGTLYHGIISPPPS